MTLREALAQIASLDARDLDLNVEVHPLGGVILAVIVTPRGFAWASVALATTDLQVDLPEFVSLVTTPITASLLGAVRRQAVPVEPSALDVNVSLDWPAPRERKH